MTETKALLRLLFRREDIVSHVRDGPIDIRSLTEVVDVSRPTVHRSLKSLQEHDVVAETGDGYVLTNYGDLVFRRYESVIEGFDQIHQHKDLLSALEDSTLIDGALLDGADYTSALPFAPEQPIAEVEAMVRDATVVRGFSPVIIGRYVSLFHEQLTTGTVDAEVLTTPDVFEYLTDTWVDKVDETVRAGLTLLVVDDSLPFGLILVEEPVQTVCVVVYDNGTLRGVIQNDDPTAVEWARDLYESYRVEARQPEVTKE